MKIEQIVGDNIRFIREKRDWTQEDLAIVAKMSKTFIGDVERAEKTLTVRTLEKIAKALKVPTGLLVTPQGYKQVE